MFLRTGKVHHREFEVEEKCSRVAALHIISQPIQILYYSREQSYREVFFGNSC